MHAWYGLILLVFITAVWFILTYNLIKTKTNKVEEIYADIDVALKQRCDTLTNLVSAVKGYMAHEENLLEKMAAIRSRLQSPSSLTNSKVQNDNEATDIAKQCFAVIERYPELKANEEIALLMKSIMYLEENLSAARRAYNSVVKQYNSIIETIPSAAVAKMLGSRRKTYFIAESKEKENISASVK